MSPAHVFQERLRVRDALAAWRERLLARGVLPEGDHTDAIERHARAVWAEERRRESRPTLIVPSRRCPRCGIAQVPLDGVCISCRRVR